MGSGHETRLEPSTSASASHNHQEKMAGKWDSKLGEGKLWADDGVTFFSKLGSQDKPFDSCNYDSAASATSRKLQKPFDTKKLKALLNNMEFFVPPSDEFSCPLCLALMNEPQLTTCGHRFCRSCIEPLVKEQPMSECPVCNVNRFDIMADRAFERKIKGLKIYCGNKAHGCEWVGELVDVDNHLEKQCGFVRIKCAFECFGCEDLVFRKDMDAHVNQVIHRHMTLVVQQFEAQQQSFDQVVREKDAKILQLEQQIDKVETKIEHELSQKSNIKWTPVDPCHQFLCVSNGTPRGIKQCHIPERFVPSQAREIMILLGVHCGGTTTPLSSLQCITVFVEEGGVIYSKYIKVSTHRQDAWNDNTDNVWLPMPTNRVVYVDVPIEFGKNFWSDVLLTGYR